MEPRSGTAIALFFAALALAAPGAAHVDAEGPQGSGGNDAPAAAQALGVLEATSSLTVFGWVDDDQPNDVDFYRFTMEAGVASAQFDVDFAEDVYVSSDLDVGLDTELWVFDATGRLIAHDDDSDFFAIGADNDDPGSDPWADHDSFVGELFLPPGTYYVAVSYFVNDANGLAGTTELALSNSGTSVAGAQPDATFEGGVSCLNPSDPASGCTGPYQLQIRTTPSGVVDAEGAAGSGANDSPAAAQAAGVLSDNGSLTALGWVDSDQPNDVDFWSFSVGSPATGAYFDIDFAEDVRVIGDFDSGLDPQLWVFDAAGHLIAHNDDSDFFAIGAANAGTDPGSDPYADHDSFVGELLLGVGTYYAAVSYYQNDANGLAQGVESPLSDSGNAVSGAPVDPSFENNVFCTNPSDPVNGCTGPYQLQIRTTFAPEPGAGGAAAAAVLLVALGLRRRRRRP
jgi:MYXO-CTERM domain-containing protein